MCVWGGGGGGRERGVSDRVGREEKGRKAEGGREVSVIEQGGKRRGGGREGERRAEGGM